MINLTNLLAAVDLGTIKKPASRILQDGDANQNIINLVNVFIATATTIAGLIFLVMLIMGGLQWVLAGGDKASLEAARGRITNAAIGLGIVVGAIAITFVVETALGIQILNVRLGAGG